MPDSEKILEGVRVSAFMFRALEFKLPGQGAQMLAIRSAYLRAQSLTGVLLFLNSSLKFFLLKIPEVFRFLVASTVGLPRIMVRVD